MGRKRSASEANRPDGDVKSRSIQPAPASGKPKGPLKAQNKVPEKAWKLEPRPDWYAADLPAIPTPEVLRAPAQSVVDELFQYGQTLLEAENKAYTASNASSSSSHKFMSTIMASGTLEDKISALTLLVQESPLHNMKAFENLLGLAKKRSRNQALMALAAVKDLLGQGSVLPDRKLRAFAKQPGLISALQGKLQSWRAGQPLPTGLSDLHLIVWAFEDWLKKMYFDLLKVLEGWCADEVEYARSRAITYVWELLRDKPEQEENLLRLLVNKLGDKDRKIASRTSYLLLQLQISHPAMKSIVVDAIETESIFRPGQSPHAKYYAIITLNQTILGKAESALANQLLKIYFGLFVQLLKVKKNSETAPVKELVNGRVQGGGGKAGKMAAKKRKAEERVNVADEELGEKMIAQVLTGVNRAFPFADTDDPTFEKHLDTIFRVTHSANFNTGIQALMLIQRISSTKHFSADRFYRVLYESLLDPRLLTSSKQILYLNLLYKSLKSDINVRRVQAFVKRLLQIVTLHEPPFICGVLFLISELETTFPSIRGMIKEAEMQPEDEEEHFVDVPDGSEGLATAPSVPSGKPAPETIYDARKRDPEHSNADRSALWDILPFLAHFHPSVAVFAESIVFAKPMPGKPDPSHHTLMHFLDRFIYRNAKAKGTPMRGASIMQPLSGSNAADLLVKARDDGRSVVPFNTEAFRIKNVSDIAPDEVFFHSYFNQANKTKPTKKKAKPATAAASDESDQSDMEEDEIWKALVDSKPEIEGSDEDDDLSIGDLESAYSDSDDEAGDGDEDEGVHIADFPDEDLDGMEDDNDIEDELPDGQDADDLPDLDSGDDAMFNDDDDLPSDFEGAVAKEPSEAQAEGKGKNKKRKLKNLPTFASMEDYQKMLDAEPDEQY